MVGTVSIAPVWRCNRLILTLRHGIVPRFPSAGLRTETDHTSSTTFYLFLSSVCPSLSNPSSPLPQSSFTKHHPMVHYFPLSLSRCIPLLTDKSWPSLGAVTIIPRQPDISCSVKCPNCAPQGPYFSPYSHCCCKPIVFKHSIPFSDYLRFFPEKNYSTVGLLLIYIFFEVPRNKTSCVLFHPITLFRCRITNFPGVEPEVHDISSRGFCCVIIRPNHVDTCLATIRRPISIGCSNLCVMLLAQPF